MISSATVFDFRQESDYEDFFTIDPDEAAPWIVQADQFIHHVATLIKNAPRNGLPWRIAFAFDPQRQAVLLAAADKSGSDKKRVYRKLITSCR